MTAIGCTLLRHALKLSHMTDSLLTTGEAADILGLARQTVWCRVKSGALKPAMKLAGNRGYLFDKDDILTMAAKEAQR